MSTSQVVPETEYYNELVLEVYTKWGNVSGGGGGVAITFDAEQVNAKKTKLLQRMRKSMDKLMIEVGKISGHNDVAEQVVWRVRLLQYEAMLHFAQKEGFSIAPTLNCDAQGLLNERLSSFFHELIPIEAYIKTRQQLSSAAPGSNGVTGAPAVAETDNLMNVLRGNLAERAASVLEVRLSLPDEDMSANDKALLSFYEDYVLKIATEEHHIPREQIPVGLDRQERHYLEKVRQEVEEVVVEDDAPIVVENAVGEKLQVTPGDNVKDVMEMDRMRRQAEMLLAAQKKLAEEEQQNGVAGDEEEDHHADTPIEAKIATLRCLPDPRGKSVEELRAHLVQFYGNYNPQKVEGVDDILVQYGDSLPELFVALELKYLSPVVESENTDPAAASAAPTDAEEASAEQPPTAEDAMTATVAIGTTAPSVEEPSKTPEDTPAAGSGGKCAVM